jgi:transcription initiation factor TFIIB
MDEMDKYLNLNDDDIDKLLMGVDLSEDTNKDKKILCISCNSDNFVIDNSKGYTVCKDCGVVQKEYLDKNPEFSDESKGSSRYGCPTNHFYPKSALGSKIKTRGYSFISNLQRQGQMPYKEKSLMGVLIKIQSKCKKYNITLPIIDNAKNFYKKINDSKHTKGKRKGKNRIMRCINRRSMIAACVFYACKMQGEPRSPKEIADIYDLEIKHVNRGCRKFLDYIDLEQCKFRSSKSTDFIERFASKLEIEIKYIKIAKDISENINKLDLASTHEPPSVAAGCILLVANIYHLDLTKKQISDIFQISDVTISKTYRRIHPYHNIIMYNKLTNLIVERRMKQHKKQVNIDKDNLVKETFIDYLSESEETTISSDSDDSDTDTIKTKDNIIEI